MRTHHINFRCRAAAGAAAMLTLLIPACGDDGGGASAAADSAYCKTVRNFTVATLVPVDESDPVAAAAYWKVYRAFVDAALSQAPAAVRGEWVVNAEGVRGTLSPILEKYGFDQERMMAEATDAEKAFLEEPPAEIQEAQAAIHEYESRVCGSEPYVFTDATFEAGSGSETFCETTAALVSASEESRSSGFAPDAVRAFVQDSQFATLFNEQTAKAPKEIASDVKADNAWYLKQWRDVLERYDYDMRRLILEGTAKDRAAFQQSDPAIRKAHARVAAYEEQVCGL